MRVSLTAALGICLLVPGLAQAQATTAKPQAPPPAAAKPSADKPQAPAVERREIKLSEDVLKTYVGQYEMDPGRILSITYDKGSLWGQPGEQQIRQLFPESNTKFFLKDIDVQLTFQKDAKGVVTGVQMVQRGGEPRHGKKIK